MFTYLDETGIDVVRVIFRSQEVELYSAVVDWKESSYNLNIR